MPAHDAGGASVLVLTACVLATGCGRGPSPEAAAASPAPPPGATSSPAVQQTPFATDLQFLNRHTHVVVLNGEGGGQVVVAPDYQGRVMTSTTGGTGAPSFGWIGRAAVEAGQNQPHMNVFGGEDRFWLGPEGGQFSLYFKPGQPLRLDHWQVPTAFDWDPWDIAVRSDSSVRFHKHMVL